MSTKLVKRQLNSLAQQQGGQEAQAQATRTKRLRAKRVSTKRKELRRAAAASDSAKQTLKNNLRYFRNSKKPSDMNQELMDKLLQQQSAAK